MMEHEVLVARMQSWREQAEREITKPAFMQDDVRCDPYKLLKVLDLAALAVRTPITPISSTEEAP